MSYGDTEVEELILSPYYFTTSYNSVVSKISDALSFTDSTCHMDISKLMHNNIIFRCIITLSVPFNT